MYLEEGIKGHVWKLAEKNYVCSNYLWYFSNSAILEYELEMSSNCNCIAMWMFVIICYKYSDFRTKYCSRYYWIKESEFTLTYIIIKLLSIRRKNPHNYCQAKHETVLSLRCYTYKQLKLSLQLLTIYVWKLRLNVTKRNQLVPPETLFAS